MAQASRRALAWIIHGVELGVECEARSRQRPLSVLTFGKDTLAG